MRRIFRSFKTGISIPFYSKGHLFIPRARRGRQNEADRRLKRSREGLYFYFDEMFNTMRSLFISPERVLNQVVDFLRDVQTCEEKYCQ